MGGYSNARSCTFTAGLGRLPGRKSRRGMRGSASPILGTMTLGQRREVSVARAACGPTNFVGSVSRPVNSVRRKSGAFFRSRGSASDGMASSRCHAEKRGYEDKRTEVRGSRLNNSVKQRVVWCDRLVRAAVLSLALSESSISDIRIKIPR